MRTWWLIFLLTLSAAVWAQSSNSSSSAPANSPTSSSARKSSVPAPNPNLEPPRSDSVNIRDVPEAEPGESSSKETQIDLSPPIEDLKAHPKNSENPADSAASDGGDVAEFHAWDPHHAAKDIEVGDFYFKRKNYAAAESRYREALYYKDNDAVATYQLAVCLEKLQRPDEAREQYQNYLKILPHGPQTEDAKKALDRLKGTAAAKNQ
jgi:tetratricopeptide (TPR) repeat protein